MRIGITIGDPGGIGPEIVLKAIQQLPADCQWVVYGPRSVRVHPFFKDQNQWPSSVEWIDTGELSTDYVAGSADARNGRAVEAMLKTANADALSGKIEALVTAPISKTSLYLAGSKFTGHTTMLQSLSESRAVSMGFYSPKLMVLLATIHIPLMTVPSQLTPERLEIASAHAFEFAQSLGIPFPKVAISGLNPHAGENGLFGLEETQLIEPVVKQLKARGYQLTGPVSPDTVFRRAVDGEFDVVVALYHDQGLIPIKLLAFEESVNVTVGLPYIRVSPDHGTAFDIAYQGKASSKSLVAAAQLVIDILERKSQ